eukprot:NODE_485_length_7794_cov_0.605848.p1 type:complete len:869 gc:universal NODE_485_length_7794_cov_0.605848:3209-5815(+)
MTWTVDVVRKTFVDYFGKQQHQIVSSCPVVLNDPTLLFTNAGMNPFKPFFLGLKEPTHPRIANYQKCIRAGGKHNDLEDVGRDSYHHTFFEMLGNWSFGDYFKKEAICWAWDLLINHYKLDPSRIYVTVYKGSDTVPKDVEAAKIWSKFLPSSRILEFDDTDNFWEMGAVGPCGPCSEVHYDLIGNRDASQFVNMDDPTVIEIWNLVFIQYDRQADHSLKSLPNKHVDTGMGLERISCILQNKHSNYDIDTFARIFASIQQLTNARSYSGKFNTSDVGGIDTAYRVIADHIRTLCFAIGDQVYPSNEGRGYVLRRILRRGINYARKLNPEITNLFSSLVNEISLIYGHVYPELVTNQSLIYSIILDEELSFGKTLDRGLKLFNNLTPIASTISGKDAFKLYDTFGFPMDLTRLLADEKGLLINEEEFVQEMELAKEKSRQVVGKKQSNLELDVHLLNELQSMNVPFTDDSFKYSIDVVDCEILQLVYNGKLVNKSAGINDLIGVITNKTCFYGESGGQVGDVGLITTNDCTLTVLDTMKYNQYVLHVCKVDGALVVPCSGTASIDIGNRKSIKSNHTATHVLNHKLRHVLGDTVDQKGSLVTNDKLRFDYSSTGHPTTKELQSIEDLINKDIEKNHRVHYREVELNIARLISGLRAVFNEQYPDPVRVVAIGVDLDEVLLDPMNVKWREYSIEFCGGTHLDSLSGCKEFMIIEETSIAKGIRRIIGITGKQCREYAMNADTMTDVVTSMENTKSKESIDLSQGLLLDSMPLPYLVKLNLKNRYAAVKTEVLGILKQKQMKLVVEIQTEMNEFLIDNSVYIKVVQLDKKMLQQVFGVLKGMGNKSCVLINKLDCDKIGFQAQVGKVTYE